jgi:hypothetical protein
MPHAKIAVISTIQSANSALGNVDQGVIADAETLPGLAAAIGLTSDDVDTINRLYPETQEVVLQAVKIAAAAGRRPYLTWRHSAIQRLEITVPPPGVADVPMDIAIHSRYVDDGLGTGPATPA